MPYHELVEPTFAWALIDPATGMLTGRGENGACHVYASESEADAARFGPLVVALVVIVPPDTDEGEGDAIDRLLDGDPWGDQ